MAHQSNKGHVSTDADHTLRRNSTRRNVVLWRPRNDSRVCTRGTFHCILGRSSSRRLLFYGSLKPFVLQHVANDTLATSIAVGTIFLVTLIVVSYVTMRISDFVLDSRIGALDRTLGFVFGAAAASCLWSLLCYSLTGSCQNHGSQTGLWKLNLVTCSSAPDKALLLPCQKTRNGLFWTRSANRVELPAAHLKHQVTKKPATPQVSGAELTS